MLKTLKLTHSYCHVLDRWQGYHIGLSNYGARSLLNCVPSSIASNLPKAIPNPIPGVETHGITITDQIGSVLLTPPTKPFKDTEGGVWVFFEDGSQEFCNILVGTDGINSPSNADVSVPQHLMDKANKIHGNFLVRKALGTKGDSTLMLTRLIPIKQDEKSEPHYRVTLVYSYLSELDSVDVNLHSFIYIESDKVKVDDNDPALVIEHVKRLIRTLRPDYIDPMSIKSWTSSRVVLLGDAAHAMSPILGLGANNAIQDADKPSQALLKYTDSNISFMKKKY
ncbi:hypothetical protein GLOIN_2v1674085 [Rhizophagus irregularis DAOM 181602=DAOM 197198]|uniref:FAD-binding domain-containing protein n=1 Tax=Rhizophagus irregularis (strain DAOM 181602 / DAOM 197198 / MUCL 43194) TaxID=747089 RepID=A0A2P4PGQ9_RHIID|nr:hypothetical protein GLOIN_2v1674085 [Rhizophagus irregularis DAOM 181602=DAOM 197198]POG64572.1 hypothetical protein GLOIN_2v1674085 [Rhizophagus irregularis DAOM 181602=DAOM 197198]|eukprot:XP_025171438.1 hypothetical protein GLOIN_2v1674085 [Rhizophagus irregularis DAOM 181602=DAOM 197198]